MSSNRTVRERISEHPQTVPGIVVGIGVTIVLAVVLRVGSGVLLEDAINHITYVAMIGGGLGATAMFAVYQWTEQERFAPIEFWARTLGDGDLRKYRRQGLYLHVTYGAIVGSFYPRLLNELTPGLAGNWFGTLPASLFFATLFALAVFVVGFIYAQIGLFRLEMQPRPILRFLGYHVVFGLVLGLATGLSKPVIVPLLGL